MSAIDLTAEPLCHLTAAQAAQREAPIDRVLERGEFRTSSNGYEIRLPRDDASWRIANRFLDEEAVCCPAMAFEIVERDNAIILHAWFVAMI